MARWDVLAPQAEARPDKLAEPGANLECRPMQPLAIDQNARRARTPATQRVSASGEQVSLAGRRKELPYTFEDASSGLCYRRL